jgi:hypothetical protein
LGDTNESLAQEASKFFSLWGDMLAGLFEQARSQGRLKQDVDSVALAHLVMSTIEGALLICKASKDTASFKQSLEALKRLLHTAAQEKGSPRCCGSSK